MAYDNFIAEVDAELRKERVITFWRLYGFSVIVGGIILILAMTAYQIYHNRQMDRASNIGDIFIKSLDLADARRFDEVIPLLESIKASDLGGYPFLARLREASLLFEQGDSAKSVEVFDALAEDERAPQILRKVARVRAAYILVDTGTLDDVKKRASDMANDLDPMRMSAREALGLASYKANRVEDAAYYFRKISEEGALGLKITERAKIMLELIHAEVKVNKG